jgi:hypothetical protein
MYPDYRYLPRGKKRKSATSGKEVASAAPNEPTPKRKKVKVLTHRPCYIEPATVPEFGGETSSATEAKEPALTQRIEEPAAMPKASSAKLAEPKADNIEEIGVEGTKILEVLSPSAEVTVPKAQKGLTATPKRKRMASVLDVLETIKTSSSTPGKTVEASKTQTDTRLTEAEATKSQANTEAGPSKPVKEKSLETGEKAAEKEAVEQILPKKLSLLLPKHFPKLLIILYNTLRGKDYLKKRFLKLNTMPEN